MILKCNQDIVQDGVLCFKEGKYYEAYTNRDGSIDAVSESGEHFGVSTIEGFSFDDHFEIIG